VRRDISGNRVLAGAADAPVPPAPPLPYNVPVPRSWLRRTLWAVVGLCFAGTASGAALHACPEHGAMMLGMASQGARTGGTECLDAPGQSAESGGTHRGHDGSGHRGHPCTCPGACCATQAVALASGRAAVAPPIPPGATSLAPLPPSTVRALAAPDVRLPPTLGPPSTQV